MNTIIIIIPVEVGTLTEIKANRIREALADEFDSMIHMGANVILTGNGKQMAITNNQIQCSFNDGIEEHIVNNIFNRLFDLLMIESTVNNSTIVVNKLTNSDDAMSFTKQTFKSLIDSSIGVGIREFFIYKDTLSEIKVEPFIEDNTKIYIEARYNIKALTINTLKNVLKDIKDDYNIKESELFSKIK